jgi:hypothetical protein
MLNKWRIASWILGVSAALGLFGYAYFYSMAVRAVLTDFYRYVNTLASPGAMREVFRVFESSAGPVSVALAMAEKRTAPTGPLPLERPPRSSRR